MEILGVNNFTNKVLFIYIKNQLFIYIYKKKKKSILRKLY